MKAWGKGGGCGTIEKLSAIDGHRKCRGRSRGGAENAFDRREGAGTIVTLYEVATPTDVFARCESSAVLRVKAMRMPYLGRRMTMGRASIVWP